MRYFLPILIVLLFSACSGNRENKAEAEKNSAVDTNSEKMLGERIDGPANIRDSIGGKILFTLNDNVVIETGPTKNNWAEVSVFIDLKKTKLVNDRIPPNTDLITSDGETIGKTVDTVDTWMGNDQYGSVGGYSSKANIKPQSVPENVLFELLKENKRSKKELQPYMNSFNFKRYDMDSLPGITQYFIYESIVVDPSPIDRITLLFKEDKLIGFIHSREIEIPNCQTYELARKQKLTITIDIPRLEIIKLIENRNRFYNSVD
jgi:hypothetical protein